MILRWTIKVSQTPNNTPQSLIHLARSALQQVVSPNERPETPPSAAVNAASKNTTPKFTAKLFDPEVHIASNTDVPIASKDEENEDSFVANIESRTPLRMTTTREDAFELQTDESKENKDNPFSDQIKTISPTRRVSRIEDSVEALDALEEEIEKVGDSIPATGDDLQSPLKIKKQAKDLSKAPEKKAKGASKAKKAGTVLAQAEVNKSSTRTRPISSRPSLRPTLKDAKISDAHTVQSRTGAVSGSTPSTSKTTPYKAPAPPPKRVSSIHKAPFQPIKSTKAPTRSTFELPGEAISRKLKEQREERLKREDEEKSKQRNFKARPVRLSQAPEVRLTASAKARLSMAHTAPVEAPKPIMAAMRPKSAVSSGALAASTNKRASSISVAKRNAQPLAPTAIKRAPSNIRTSISRQPNVSAGESHPAPTAEGLAHRKVKGKEVFSRGKLEIEEREKVRKEKEEAAKKARVEAAERGRAASRQWAEKQRVRKMAALTALKEKPEGNGVVA